MQRCTLLEGRALSIGRNLSYYPIIQTLKSWADIAETDSSPIAAQKLETAVLRQSGKKGREIYPFIATLMGLPLSGAYFARMKNISGPSLEKLILKNLRELLELIIADKPLIIFIEDLHWCDLSSIELLESLFRLATDHPVLFVNTFRPDYPDTSNRITAVLFNRFNDLYEEIRLEPLNTDSCRQLIENLVKSPGMPKKVMQMILQRADGNPFFIEEVLHSLVDQNLIEIRNGEIHFAESIDHVVIPETIQDVLMARLDRFDEETRSLLKLASVIGRYFFYKILREVSGDITDIDEHLDDLQEAQVIRRRQRLNEIEYLFKHVLTQEVAYESILFNQRKKLHADVARAIEIVFAQRLTEFYPVLAFHYSRTENMEKAEEYLIKAGEEALKNAASNEALSHYQNALNLYLQNFGERAHPQKIAKLELNIAMAFYNKGRMADAIEYFDRAQTGLGEPIPQNKRLQNLRLLRDLLYFLFELYLPIKRPKKKPTTLDNRIINLYHYRADALVSTDSRRLVLNAMDVLQRITRFRLNDFDFGVFIFVGACGLFAYSGLSFRIAGKVLDYVGPYMQNSDMLSAIRFRFHKTLLLRLSGRWPGEIILDETLVDKCLEIGEIWQTGGYLLETGFLHVHRGQFGPAELIVEKLNDMANTFENSYPRARSFHLLTLIQIKQGRFLEARQTIDDGLDYLKDLNEPLYVILLWAFRLIVAVHLRQSENAGEAFATLNRLLKAEDAVFPYFKHTCDYARLLYTGERIAGTERPAKGETHLPIRKFIHAALKTDKKIAEGQPETFRQIGTLSYLKLDFRGAARWWRKSLARASELEMKPDYALTCLEIVRRIQALNDLPEQLKQFDQKELLDHAGSTFSQLQMNHFTEDLENLHSMRLEYQHVQKEGE